MKSSILTAATLLITAAAAQDSNPNGGDVGCFSALPSALFSANSTSIFNTQGLCRDKCRSAGPAYLYAALQGNQCFCGIGLPLVSDRVAEERCSFMCPGYPTEMCGGEGVYTVLITSPNGDGGSSSLTSVATMSSLSGAQVSWTSFTSHFPSPRLSVVLLTEILIHSPQPVTVPLSPSPNCHTTPARVLRPASSWPCRLASSATARRRRRASPPSYLRLAQSRSIVWQEASLPHWVSVLCAICSRSFSSM